MPLNPFRADAQWRLRGVVADDLVSAPLGRFYWRVGPHFLGIDDSFKEPLVARAYYDPTLDTHRPAPPAAKRTGYIQSVQVYFGGVPVPPEAYGGHLAARTPYAGDGGFVDFMGPRDAVAFGRGRAPHPFYAYNGSLGTGDTEFGSYPRRNGVLLMPADVTGRARCASLVAAVSPGHLTAEELGGLLTAGNLLRTIPCAPEELASRGAYALAVAAVNELDVRRHPDITCSVVGPYMLVERLATSYCLRADTAGTSIAVHELPARDVEAARGFAVMDAMVRMTDHIRAETDAAAVVADLDQTILPELAPIWVARGPAPTEAGPFGASEFAVEWRYTTYLVADVEVGTSDPLGSLVPLHGFSWSVCQEYDPDAGTLAATSVTEPRFLGEFPDPAPLHRYYRVVARADGPISDGREFAAAGLPRPEWAVGPKIAGIDLDGFSTITDAGAPRRPAGAPGMEPVR